MTETKNPKLSEILRQKFFRRTTEDLLNKKLRPAGAEAVENSSLKQPAGFTAQIEQPHPGEPPLTITAETRAELDEKIKNAGLEQKTMIIVKNPPDK